MLFVTVFLLKYKLIRLSISKIIKKAGKKERSNKISIMLN